MEDTKAASFEVKFRELNEQNQKYIIAIQQALIYAQTVEKAEKPDTYRVSVKRKIQKGKGTE